MNVGHGTWILVGDGEKALVLINQGDAQRPVFETLRVLEQENPPTREQGTDAPGRHADGPGSHKSAVQNTDWHKLAKHRFAADIADSLYKSAHAGRFNKLVIVAPPRTLGDLRQELHAEVADRVVAEIDKSLTNLPLHEIEDALAAAA